MIEQRFVRHRRAWPSGLWLFDKGSRALASGIPTGGIHRTEHAVLADDLRIGDDREPIQPSGRMRGVQLSQPPRSPSLRLKHQMTRVSGNFEKQEEFPTRLDNLFSGSFPGSQLKGPLIKCLWSLLSRRFMAVSSPPHRRIGT